MGWLGRLFGGAPAKPAPRTRTFFAGAQQNRLTRDFLDQWMSGRQELRYELRTLRMRSRELCRNTPIGQRYLGLVDENVLGHEGITLQMRMTGANGEPDEEANQAIEAAWAEWGRLGNCTLDGRYSWRDFEGAALEQTARDGDGLVELIEGARNEYGFAVQLIDPDRLDGDMNINVTGRTVVMGVEVDRVNRPLTYHILTEHPADVGGGRNATPVPAVRILHLGRHRRVGQVRYEPWMTPVLLTVKMLDEYQFTELVGARVSAGKMGFILPAPDDAGPDPERTPEEQEVEFEAQPGIWKRLAPGETVQESNPTHPGQQFDPFVRSMLRQVASGLHVSVAGLTGDYTDVTYSSGRLASLAERDRWRVLQRWYSQSLHQRVFAKWLEWAVLRKKVRLPGTLQDAVRAASWEFRGWPWVDPEKDGNATAKECAMGINDLITAAAERGRDFEQVVKNQARAMAIAKKYQVPISLDVPEKIETTSTAVDAGPPKKPQPAPADDMEEAEA